MSIDGHCGSQHWIAIILGLSGVQSDGNEAKSVGSAICTFFRTKEYSRHNNHVRLLLSRWWDHDDIMALSIRSRNAFFSMAWPVLNSIQVACTSTLHGQGLCSRSGGALVYNTSIFAMATPHGRWSAAQRARTGERNQSHVWHDVKCDIGARSEVLAPLNSTHRPRGNPKDNSRKWDP